MHRPRIPLSLPRKEPYSVEDTPYPLFVSDEALQSCSRPIDNCLYANITTLLITREVIRRFCVSFQKGAKGFFQWFAAWVNKHLTPILCIAYILLFFSLTFVAGIQALEHFIFTPILDTLGFLTSIFNARGLGRPSGPTLYEFLIVSLFFPLIMVALSGWLRTILIWGALSRGLLEPLERAPLRCAFSRVKGGSWMSMLRQSGLHVRWRDMSRSSEAIRQIINHPQIKDDHPDLALLLSEKYKEMNWYVHLLMLRLAPLPEPGGNVPHMPLLSLPYHSDYRNGQCSDSLQDFGPYPKITDLCLMRSLEVCYAEFCRVLLGGILIPHWEHSRVAFVEDCTTPGDAKAISADTNEKTTHGKDEHGYSRPSLIALAEELLVVRYVALIRAVLVNIRYLMVFVAAVFVLTLVAWNTYPFQPHALIDWCFTILLALTSIGFITVFAQMHRNAILSRITDSTPNELGWDFYLRLITFGAIPVLTWLAYQFPQIGGSLYRILQPGLQVVK